jgi:hypothetical protein
MKTNTGSLISISCLYLTGISIGLLSKPVMHSSAQSLTAGVSKGLSLLFLAGFLYGAWKLHSSMRGK